MTAASSRAYRSFAPSDEEDELMDKAIRLHNVFLLPEDLTDRERMFAQILRDSCGEAFRIYGGMRFYDRKEIKDTLAYLRLINDSKDDLAFDRIINVPKRGIGDTTVDKIRAIAAAEHVSMMDVARRASQYEELMRSANKLYGFCKLIDEFTVHLEEDEMSFPDFVDYVENESGMIQEMIDQRESKGELTDRVENLKELLSEAAEFEKNHRTSEETDNSELQSEIEDDEFLEEETATADTLRGILALYLENAALYSQGDSDDDNEDYVKLMSIHSSKGLEFGAVFLIGVEDGIFPSYKSIASAADTEEEAIAIINDTTYGLSNSVFSADRFHAMEVAAQLESGMVHVNDQTIGEEFHVMFGAEKQSGLGRFNGKWVLEKFTTEQWISVK